MAARANIAVKAGGARDPSSVQIISKQRPMNDLLPRQTAKLVGRLIGRGGKKDLGMAEVFLELAINSYPKRWSFRTRLIEVYLRQRKTKKARQVFDAAVKEEVANAAMVKRVVDIYLKAEKRRGAEPDTTDGLYEESMERLEARRVIGLAMKRGILNENQYWSVIADVTPDWNADSVAQRPNMAPYEPFGREDD